MLPSPSSKQLPPSDRSFERQPLATLPPHLSYPPSFVHPCPTHQLSVQNKAATSQQTTSLSLLPSPSVNQLPPLIVRPNKQPQLLARLAKLPKPTLIEPPPLIFVHS
ncbi:hypothetical protein PGTUg99_022644 [Puccinia graminis f. sp. tritici]|uniref:Uncharacterized protein n=1 Tax=Puccinia graminis f. sp. tritici TaxID=56615 RepID=A0A5B0LQY9_PUCGR|nr:hypothetical protein PGTUg99_022644 [Puccinia graminis f. sp. tritici]